VKRILVVDDEQSMRELLAIMLNREGFEVLQADSRAMAASVLARDPVDMVITDIRLPDGDGIEILRHVKAASPDTVVIVMTAYGSTEAAVGAMKLGAHDYLTKPFDVEELKIVVRNALEKRRLEEENLRLRAELRGRHGLDRIIGTSPSLVAVLETAKAVAGTSSTVLITGESGTGKELVAKAIHALSPRRDAPFVSVNCGALPENLLESELFGHVKGAFTDAHQTRKGLFEAAHRGTLFLDEVGETPPSMQVKLLRALQERRIRRVGGTEEIDVDVRVMAATNHSLEELVQERRFREDLFYRLNVIPLRIPPLRERREDIPLLANHFLQRFSRDMGKPVTSIADESMALLARYDWPGNIRELENVIERVMALETTAQVQHARLRDLLQPRSAARFAASLGDGFSLDEHLRAIEADFLRSAMGQAGEDRGLAAKLLGVSRRSLRYLIGKHGRQHGAREAGSTKIADPGKKMSTG
jgi:two-component system response regulator PilR (NtrC family)